MPRKKGWTRIKRKSRGLPDHDYLTAFKKRNVDQLHLTDHNYYSEEMDQAPKSDDVIYYPEHSYEDISQTTFHDDTDVGESVDVTLDNFENMHVELCKNVEEPYSVLKLTGDKIQIVEMYKSTTKLCLIISRDMTVKLYVHNRPVAPQHRIFEGLKTVNVDNVIHFLKKVQSTHVCIGNTEQQFVELMPSGNGLSKAGDNKIIAYIEQDFGARRGNSHYGYSVRSTECDLLLVNWGERCVPCNRTRAILRNRDFRKKQKKNKSRGPFMNSKANHATMDRNQLMLKLNEQKNVIQDLQKEVLKLKRQVEKSIREDGVEMDRAQSLGLTDLMSSCESEVVQAFPDSNSFQRLFWDQQMKEAKSGKKLHEMASHDCQVVPVSATDAKQIL